MQLVAFTKRVQSNNRVTEYYEGEQLFYCYDSWCEKCTYPELTEHVSPPYRYVGNFDHFLTPLLPIWYLLLNSSFRC
jgi:hypothetical protein